MKKSTLKPLATQQQKQVAGGGAGWPKWPTGCGPTGTSACQPK